MLSYGFSMLDYTNFLSKNSGLVQEFIDQFGNINSIHLCLNRFNSFMSVDRFVVTVD